MERSLKEKLEGGRFVGGTPGNTRRMKAIRDRSNRSTEKRFRALLVRPGIKGWKLRPPDIAGKPDFYFPARRLVVFIDGCFWHGCPRCGHIPGVNRPYWKAKIERNQQRDRENGRKLREQGIRILRLWEHELQSDSRQCIRKLLSMIG